MINALLHLRMLLVFMLMLLVKTSLQAISQNVKSGRPGGISPHKFGKTLVHLASFSPRIGCPQDTLLAKSLLALMAYFVH